MGYVAIKSKLIELLGAVAGIESLYDHNPNSLAPYPAATVTALGHTDRFHDTAANVRAFQFLVRLFYRTDEDQDAEAILTDLTDKVIQQLEANVTTPGVWDIARPTTAVFRSGEGEVPVLVSEITVTIEQRVNRVA